MSSYLYLLIALKAMCSFSVIVCDFLEVTMMKCLTCFVPAERNYRAVSLKKYYNDLFFLFFFFRFTFHSISCHDTARDHRRGECRNEKSRHNQERENWQQLACAPETGTVISLIQKTQPVTRSGILHCQNRKWPASTPLC